ncbi:hypothetical protein HYH03_002922 [Edaphochlamys debaryana]|uniref:Uncharacterized protein n=1 Tax=Edaphochlamys debaryana TaxID=47281 RepID=A0A836C535_9CHLO|nr:hypothetical protein HYH03_002922 [Edaphochlamys debaryana]|eukprot:KAG2499347.1 hypothetical protein HYH03_002922 [Edaphochlamys debaryana]
MSIMQRLYNANPSRDLSYSSLAIDEQNRSQHAHKITESARFRHEPVNGNIASVAPDAADPDLRQSLPRHLQVDTSTRTVFQDSFYRPKEGVAEFAESPKHGFSGLRAQPHVPLCDLATQDTRIRIAKPPYTSPLAPGYYDPDPLGERSTGPLQLAPGDTGRGSLDLSRDPTRPSAVFQSAPRGRTARDIAEEAAAPLISSRMTEPDFAYWTSKGCWAPKGDRVIEADRWGRNAREPLPPASERPQSVYTPQLTHDGFPNSCAVYAAARDTPAYRTAFASGLPRTIALPGGNRPDTRLQVKSYDTVSGSGPDVGPGSYNPEPPRMRSTNVAYEASQPYYSLASGAPASPSASPSLAAAAAAAASGSATAAALTQLLPPALQQQLIASGALAALAASAPSTPREPVRASAAALALAPLAVGGGGGMHAGSAPSSPSAMRAAAVRAERAAAAAMLAASQPPGSPTRRGGSPLRHSPSPLGLQPMTPQYGSSGAGYAQHQPFEFGPLTTPGSGGGEGAMWGGGMGGGGGGLDGAGAHLPAMQLARARSAPVAQRGASGVAGAMRAQQSKQFNKLVFMQRHTPCASLLRSHLVVAADLRRERQRLRNGG